MLGNNMKLLVEKNFKKHFQVMYFRENSARFGTAEVTWSEKNDFRAIKAESHMCKE